MSRPALPSKSAAAPPRIVIVGGGLAGLAAAAALVDSGARVTVLESRRRAGGRAASFDDPVGGGLVEALPDLFLKGVRASAEEHAMRSFQGTFKIVTAELGDDASTRGAAAWALHMEVERR